MEEGPSLWEVDGRAITDAALDLLLWDALVVGAGARDPARLAAVCPEGWRLYVRSFLVSVCLD